MAFRRPAAFDGRFRRRDAHLRCGWVGSQFELDVRPTRSHVMLSAKYGGDIRLLQALGFGAGAGALLYLLTHHATTGVGGGIGTPFAVYFFARKQDA